MYKAMVTQLTYYDLLGIKANASLGEIEEAYQSILAKSYRPQLSEAQVMFLEKLHEAYAVLTDPSERHTYDYELKRVLKSMDKSFNTNANTIILDRELTIHFSQAHNRDQSQANLSSISDIVEKQVESDPPEEDPDHLSSEWNLDTLDEKTYEHPKIGDVRVVWTYILAGLVVFFGLFFSGVFK